MLTGPSDFHQLAFFLREQLVDVRDVLVRDRLDFVVRAVFVILRSSFPLTGP